MLATAFLRLLLSPTGAIDRGAFAGGVGLLSLAAVGVDHAMHGWTGPYGLGSFAFVVVFAWSALCLSRKRLRDFGWSGSVIPIFLGLYLFAALVGMVAIDRQAFGSLQQALEGFSLFSLPMAGWLIALAIIPGNGLASTVKSSW